jgi:hypothetical protein
MSDSEGTKVMDNASVDSSAGKETSDLEGGLDEHKDASIDQSDQSSWNWDDDPSNPYNWPPNLKFRQILMIASAAFTT